MAKKELFRVSFINHGKLYEVNASAVNQDRLYGFVEISDLVFSDESRLVLDPSEEKLREEFSGVRSTLIPIQAIIRIDIVASHTPAKIRDIDSSLSNVAQFPGTIVRPPEGPGKS